MDILGEIVECLRRADSYSSIERNFGIDRKEIEYIARSTGDDPTLSLKRSISLKRKDGHLSSEIRLMHSRGVKKREIALALGVKEYLVSKIVRRGGGLCYGDHDKLGRCKEVKDILIKYSSASLEKVAELLGVSKQRVGALYLDLYQSGFNAYSYRLGEYTDIGRIISSPSPRLAYVLVDNLITPIKIANRDSKLDTRIRNISWKLFNKIEPIEIVKTVSGADYSDIELAKINLRDRGMLESYPVGQCVKANISGRGHTPTRIVKVSDRGVIVVSKNKFHTLAFKSVKA